MDIQSQFPYRVESHPTIWITLPDGCRLAAWLWLPDIANTQPVPTILEYLPYRRRDGTTARDALTHPWFAGHGYACLRVDIRGNGDSDGLMSDEYTTSELNDACDVIEWITQQPWSNGNVGMMGISWGGFNSLQVAAMQPTALKAIITLCSTDDRYADDIHYKGGCLLNENLGWGATMLSFSSRPPDPAVVGERWRSMWLQRLQHEPFLAAVWLQHQSRDDYWRHGSVCEDYAAIKAPTLAIGGWGDAYKNSVGRLLSGLSAPCVGITGPWIHKYPHFAVPQPSIGFLQEAKQWWDRWLPDAPDTHPLPPAWRGYVMNSAYPKPWYEQRSGRWIVESQASATDDSEYFYLDSNRALSDSPGQLQIEVKSAHDTGIHGGEYCAIWMGPELPGDQRSDDAMSVCFDSPPLATARDIVGSPRLTLQLAADTPRAQLAVRLCDVHPDGASSRISYGVLNLCHRNGHDNPTLLEPGQPVEVTVQLDDIGWRIAAGHRLRVAVSSAYWPLLWPSPHATTFTLFSGRLQLPVRAGTSLVDECQFEPAVGATPWQTQTLREPANQRRICKDQVSGITSVEIRDDFGLLRDSEHGLVSGGIARETWQIKADDPLSARASLHWTSEMQRDALTARTETWSWMSSDLDHFYLSARIEAWENDELIFEKNFRETIKRNFL